MTDKDVKLDDKELSEIVPDELPGLDEESIDVSKIHEEQSKRSMGTVTKVSIPPGQNAGKIPGSHSYNDNVKEISIAPKQERKIEVSTAAAEVGAMIPGSPGEQQLFFSDVMSNFRSPELRQEIENRILNTDTKKFISSMQQSFDIQKKMDSLKELESQILEKMDILPRLEHDWRKLQVAVIEQSHQMKQKEDSIKDITSELKKLLTEKNELLEKLDNDTKKYRK
ncbi:hypothetical protein H6503_02815 [Candidatus Woesearchaeota archaeon]|nr:hypothetical protein [Candidatus Woesearchaeota archaeon]